MDLALYFSLVVTMFSWVRVLDGVGASWEVRETSSRIFSVVWSSFSSLPLPFTLYLKLRSSSFVWRPTNSKKYSPLTSLTNSKLEFVSAKTASWNCYSDSLANFALRTDFFFFSSFCWHVPSDMRVYPHSAKQGKCHSRPVFASCLPHASRRRLDPLYMNATGFWSR